MDITVNGEVRRLERPTSVQKYLEEMQLAQLESGIAVVLNGEVVRRADWPTLTLQASDEMEVVKATVGG